MTVYKTKWYLVRSDQNGQPWKFFVLTKTFGSMKAAKQHARAYALDEYRPQRGKDVLHHVEDQRAGLAVEVIWEG